MKKEKNNSNNMSRNKYIKSSDITCKHKYEYNHKQKIIFDYTLGTADRGSDSRI